MVGCILCLLCCVGLIYLHTVMSQNHIRYVIFSLHEGADEIFSHDVVLNLTPPDKEWIHSTDDNLKQNRWQRQKKLSLVASK